MPASGDELHDIADPRPLLPGIEVPLWFWVSLAALVCASASFLVLFLRRRGGPAPLPERSAFARACGALEHLRDSLPERPFSEIATEASFIMREYLATALEDPALYETHEEFLLRDDALARLPTGARERLAPLLDELAAAKYSPSAPAGGRSAELVTSCLEVLRGVESTRERQVA